MIPLIEDYLTEILESKFGSLKSNPNQIDKIIGASKPRRDRLKAFISSNPIRVVRGYPRTPAELPCICIMLSNEDENQDSLGDYSEYEDDVISSATDSVSVVSTPGGKLGIPYCELTNKPVSDIEQVVNQTKGFILHESEYNLVDPDLGLVGLYGGDSEHGDTLSVVYSYKQSTTTSSEVMYESNYRLEAWASNGDLAVDLYHLTKWALLSSRDELVNTYDIPRQKLGGGDFEPATQYFPDFVYRRAVTFWCQFIVSAASEDVSYISDVEDNLNINFSGR